MNKSQGSILAQVLPPNRALCTKLLSGSTFASLTVVSAGYSHAQGTTGVAEDQAIEEIVVTARKEFFRPSEASSATKFNLPIFDTPQSISVITDDLIDSVRPEDLLQIDKYVAGVYSMSEASIGTAYYGGSGFLRARGFEVDSDNGFKINGFSTLGSFYPDLVTVERVEFVKGPSAVIYGVNNYGGTVNVLTKSPPTEFESEIAGVYGSFDYKRLELDIGGPLTESGSVRFRIAGATEDREFIRDGEELQREAVMPTISWDISPSTTVNALMFYQEEERVFGGTLNLTLDDDGNVTVPSDLSRELFFGLPDYNKGVTEHKQFIGSFRHEFSGDFTLEGQAGYTDTGNEARFIYTYNFFGPAAPTTYAYNRNYQQSIESSDAELRFGGEFELFGRRHDFLVNGEYRQIKRDDPRYAYAFLGSTSQFDPDFSFIDITDPAFESLLAGYTKEGRDNYGIGAQVLLNLTDDLSLLVGARQTYSDIKYEDIRDFVGGVDPDLAEYEVTADFRVSEFTPRIGVVYNLTDAVNLYASYSQGFIPQTGTTRAGGIIEPETGTQYEAGIKTELFEGSFGFSAAIYSIDRDEVEALDPDNLPSEDFVVAGREQRHKGIELEAIGQIVDGLNIVATYTYQDAEVTADANDPTIVGNDVRHVPTNLGSAFVQYHLLEGALAGLSASIGYNYYSSYYQREDNEFRFHVPDRHTFDAFLAYERFEHVSFDLAITNFTDEKAIYTAFFDRYSSFTFEEPRTIRGRIRVKW